MLRQIESYVISIGYLAIDYNLMVFQDGDVWEGRGLSHEDAATKDHNSDSVSICAVGNFETTSFHAAALSLLLARSIAPSRSAGILPSISTSSIARNCLTCG